MTSPRKTSHKFGPEYYSNGNYLYYAERRERYHRTARELVDFFQRYELVAPGQPVLDFGCGFGFLAEGLQNGGCRAFGYDISDEACKQAKANHVNLMLPNCVFPGRIQMAIALDVLEHMTDAKIASALEAFEANHWLVRIPCAANGYKRFYLKISRADKTHINCKDKPSWCDFMRKNGFPFFAAIDLLTIYDSEGVLAGIFSREPLRLQ